MTTYKVYPKGSDVLAYAYDADAPVEWNEFPFAEFNHVPQPPPPLPPGGVYGGRRKLTKLEWRKLLTTDEQKALDRLEAKFETMTSLTEDMRDEIRTNFKKFDEATIMDLDDPDEARGLGLLVALGYMAPNRIAEILNG